MPHADAPPIAAAPTGDPQARAHRLEALCALAAETAACTDPAELWQRIRGALGPVAGADAAALAAPGLDAPLAWRAAADTDEADGGALAGLLAAAGHEAREVPLPGGGTALVTPLRHRDEACGTLLVGWSGADEVGGEAREAAALLAAQAAGALANARAYARLTEAAYGRERFFSAMSHDLRTPITAIVGYSELLVDGIVGGLNRQQQEMVERISQVSAHLSQLVNDILDIAKLDAGRMEFHLEQVHLGELVEQALVLVEPQAAAKGLALRTEAAEALRAERVRVDPDRVRQILVNLLSNAVKFTEAGQVVVLAGTEGGRAWIRVRDTGPGLPAGAEEAMFEEFLQIAAGTRSKREPGSGLGLAVSRRLARAMGGELRAANAPGGGAAFTLVLPADRGEG